MGTCSRTFMLSKIKSDKRLNRLCIGLPATRVLIIRDFIQSDAYRSHEQVRELFQLRHRQAEGLCLHFRDESVAGEGVCFGSKTEPYYANEAQMLEMPSYSIEDLSWRELEILNK